jgi:26S proteasome regulatory subunit N5
MNLERKDFVRTLIQSRKMNKKVLEEDGFDAVKVSFYTMMVDYHTHEKDPWAVCQAYHKIYDTQITKDDAVKRAGTKYYLHIMNFHVHLE